LFFFHLVSPSIDTKHYILHPIDLTDLEAVKAFFSNDRINKEFIIIITITFRLPTLFLSECVLIYIEPDSINPTLQYIQNTFPNSGFVVYEQIRPLDPFGAMMVKNLNVDFTHSFNEIGTWM
jgi:singapore isolate B (sub-type 7) whole genome shotgun sequence assembly, scaffold_7